MLADMAVTTAHTKYRSTRFDMPSREELAADWTPAMDRGWAGLLAGALPGRRSFVSL